MVFVSTIKWRFFSFLQVFENELRVYAEEGIDVTVSAAVYTSSCLRMLTGKRDGVLPVWVISTTVVVA